MKKTKKHIHILAICGYSTSGLAVMAKKLGYKVTGSDEGAYPPATAVLDKAGIKWADRHAAGNLKRWGQPDLVIQGNQIRSGNVELLAARKLSLPVISDSEFFYELAKGRNRIAVCGSHGKTTVSALIAWILEVDGRKPGFRLGSQTLNFKTAVRLGDGPEFVFEGDEYTTNFNDSRPKFFHFHPQLAVINNIEWDHPDVFHSPAEYRENYRKYLVGQMPENGILIINAEDKNILEVVSEFSGRIFSFGLTNGEVQCKSYQLKNGRTEISVVVWSSKLQVSANTEFIVETALPGEHNIRNCLAAITAALALGVKPDVIQSAIKSFKGTSRRFEITGRTKGVVVIDDYAHHPTKAKATISAARQLYPAAGIYAVYVPHTYSRTKALLKDYGGAFLGANTVIITNIEPARERKLKALIHARDLVNEIKKNQDAVFYLSTPSKILIFLQKNVKPGDIVLCMSVSGFDDLAKNLVSCL